MGRQTRRSLLGWIGAAPLISCTNLDVPSQSWVRGYSRRPWTAPRIARRNVIREVVGHRPYRASGFVVRSEQLDDKTVVHNYGHGGGGISLAWGSSALALQELAGRPPGVAAVIGSGVIGLTSARLLQDAGWSVTIYTRDVARHTTSNVAAGEWGPVSVYDPAVASEAFVSRFEWAARISFHAYTNLGGAGYGVSWVEAYELAEEPLEPASGFDGPYPYVAVLQPGEHPFGDLHARRFVTMRIEPGILLRRLVSDFQLAGGRLVIRNFHEASEVLALPEPVVFNCTGLGAAALFDDSKLMPAKGQLVFLPPDPAVDYMTLGGGRGLLYMLPRSDVLLLGGTFKLGDYTRHPDPDETERIVEEHRRLFDGFRRA